MNDQPVTREKDTDPRPLLQRLRDGLALIPGATFEDDEAKPMIAFAVHTVSYGQLSFAAWNAEQNKVITLTRDRIPDEILKVLLKIKGISTRFRGIEASWRAIPELCETLAVLAKKKTRAVAVAQGLTREEIVSAIEAVGGMRINPNTKGVEVGIWMQAPQTHSVPEFTVSPGGKGVQVSFGYNPSAVAVIRETGAKFDGPSKSWSLPKKRLSDLAIAILDAMQAADGAAMAAAKVEAAERAVQQDIWEAGRADREAARVERQAQRDREYAAQVAARPARKPRMLVLARSVSVGDVVGYGDEWRVVEGLGKTFQLNSDTASLHGSEFLGHEGEWGQYAYLDPATEAQVAAAEAKMAAERAERAARRATAVAVGETSRAIRSEGEYAPAQPMPSGRFLLESDSSLRGGIYLADGGDLWSLTYNGADGDNWAASNVGSHIGHRLRGARAAELLASLAAVGVS